MRIAYYAPLKAPDHPTPSGDRRMAGLLMEALAAAGHDVRIASRLRSFSQDPGDGTYLELRSAALAEAGRLSDAWSRPADGWSPECWFSYHPYYKAPDWMGPEVSARLGLPYVTAEASYAGKRDAGPWRTWQADVARAVRGAAANFCFTAQDREGLQRLAPLAGPLVDLVPFLDPPPLPEPARRASTAAPRIAVAAMMRPGDKLASYLALSQTLQTLLDVPWRLAVMGDGLARAEVLAAFSAIPPDRIDWLGEVPPEGVAEVLGACDVYVWPGIGEAYGLAYLEAQAMGLPVAAQDAGGVSSVVVQGETGWLTPAGDLAAYAGAVRSLLVDGHLRAQMGMAASRFVREHRSVAAAAATIEATLRAVVPSSGGAAQ
ncbi:MAG: glycosyltransferase family 4 protein [Hyphomicrobiaceae bacterium]|nr:glycosyltransferase family 4 protein [Hyphomicrobiaceae bacterium]